MAAISGPEHYFNPTLVRLGLPRIFDEVFYAPHFNPTLVRLGPGVTGCAGNLMPYFNPTLVRLGPAGDKLESEEVMPISIPLWFDWGRQASLDKEPSHQHFNPTLVRLGPS